MQLRVNTLRGLVLPVLVALADSCWLSLWIGLVSEANAFAAHRPILHGPAVFGLLLVTSMAARLALAGERPLGGHALPPSCCATVAIGLVLLAEVRRPAGGPIRFGHAHVSPPH